jgi:hypothetical protein
MNVRDGGGDANLSDHYAASNGQTSSNVSSCAVEVNGGNMGSSSHGKNGAQKKEGSEGQAGPGGASPAKAEMPGNVTLVVANLLPGICG